MNTSKFALKFGIVLAGTLLLSACATTPTEDSGTSEEVTEAPGATPGTQDDLVQNVGDRVFFGYDRYDLTGDARATLQRQAAWMKQHGQVTVTVEGHADERGTREYNLALGARRANAVRDYLVSLGVDSTRVSTISYGKERPTCVESIESCWSQNRRGVTVVTYSPGS